MYSHQAGAKFTLILPSFGVNVAKETNLLVISLEKASDCYRTIVEMGSAVVGAVHIK